MGVIDTVVGTRVSDEDESEGLEMSEHGIGSYPGFAESGTRSGGISEGGTTDD
jgi:ammonia channel protein AmtB